MSAAALLKAAKHIIAEAAKNKAVSALKRKKNPAPRKGTKKPTRASQATGKAPTKRLVKRRKSNKVEGFFPNPAEVINAHVSTHNITNLPILIQTKGKTAKTWVDICAVRNETYARKIVQCLSKGSDMMWRAIKD